MKKRNYRQLAQTFQSDGAETLKDLVNTLGEALDELPADKAGGVEKAIVEHLENALNDVFGLEMAIESVYEEDEYP